MTIEEAKRFFMSCGGSSFHMSREDEALCQAYRKLNIDKETEEAWRKELEAEKAKHATAPWEEYDAAVERLLEEKYLVVDILPRQVPAESRGQYFAAEEFYTKTERLAGLYRKFAEVLLGLNCYYDLVVSDGLLWIRNPAPERLFAKIAGCWEKEYVNILIMEEDSLISLSGGDLYMTIYHPSKELAETAAKLAAAQGLFVR